MSEYVIPPATDFGQPPRRLPEDQVRYTDMLAKACAEALKKHTPESIRQVEHVSVPFELKRDRHLDNAVCKVYDDLIRKGWIVFEILDEDKNKDETFGGFNIAIE